MFSRIIHHLDMKDVGKKHLEKLAAIKIKEEKDKKEKLVIKEISKRFESDWRKELEEGMTTTNVLSTTIAPAEGDGTVTTVDPIDAASFQSSDLFLGSGDFGNNVAAAQNATQIRSSGSGSGSTGGFDVGGDYLAFQGTQGASGARWAILKPMDATKVDSITITAIRGTGSNGGEHPDVVGTEELFIRYKTPDMNISRYLSFDRDGNAVGSFPADAAIIAINQGDGTLQNYTITIPEYARQKNVTFALYQKGNSGSQYDHYGVTDIKFQRRTPLNVVVPLDSPEAVSFIRVGTDEGDPKKRKKKVNDQLAASDEYVAKQMGGEFPGQGARIDGEDPFRSAPITSDEEIKSSPIGKDEVKKSFSDFSDDAADATAEPEPEPVEPAVQTTLAPRNLDGTKIRVKSVGKVAVQGVDAANLDAQDTTEPETTNIEPPEESKPESDTPDPKDVKLSDDEKKGKTKDQIKADEEEKKQNWFQKTFGKMMNYTQQFLDDVLFNLDDVKGVDDLLGWVSNAIMTSAGGVFQMLEQIPGVDLPYVSGGSTAGKMHNNISIFRSIVSGKIVNHVPTVPELQMFRNYITPNLFEEGHRSYIPISSVRHEYADKNIYVLNGKVYNNRNEKATDLTNGKEFGKYVPVDVGGFRTNAPEGIGGHGTGYAQMIIPQDGGKPYLHYYDYNYHNLKNPDDLPGGIGRATTSVGSDVAHFLGMLMKIPNAGIQKAAALAQQRFTEKFNNLGNEKSFLGEGWPEGIHGAALTDFKVPLESLPQETQDYIALHPLSWTPERIANMSDDYLYEQTEILLNKEGIVYRDSDDGDSYFRDFYKLIRSKDIGLDPTYVDAVIGYNETWDKTQEALIEKAEFVESPEYEYNEAYMKASEDYDKAIDEYMEVADKLTSNEIEETAMREIPDPEGEYPEFDLENDPEVIRAKDAFEEANNKANDHWDNEVVPAINAYVDFANTLKQVGNMLEGTKSEIAQLRKLEKVGRAAVEENRRLDDEYERLEKIVIDTAEKYRKNYQKLVEPWKVADEKRQERIKELREMLYAEIDEKEKIMYDLEVKFQNTYTVRDVVDGVEIFTDGGDYTDLNGKTYDGRGTLLKPFDLKIQELNKQADEFWATQEQFGIRYLPEKLSPYLIKKQFKGKTVDWTPGKKGRGHIPGGYRSPGAKSKPKYGRGYSVSDPIVRPPTPTKKKRKKRGSGFNENYSLFEKIKSKTFFNPKDIKPTFPENPPAQIDPKTGMHPNYGKQAKRYNKLDPMSANAMPPTGDPEIDAVVDKQRTKKKPAERKKEYIKVSKVTETKTFSKIKNLRKKK